MHFAVNDVATIVQYSACCIRAYTIIIIIFLFLFNVNDIIINNSCSTKRTSWCPIFWASS